MKPARKAYTIAEVAAALEVSTYTVRREIRENGWPTLPLKGRCVRIPAAFVDELCASAARSVR